MIPSAASSPLFLSESNWDLDTFTSAMERPKERRTLKPVPPVSKEFVVAADLARCMPDSRDTATGSVRA